MKQETAEIVANAVIGAAVVGAAVVVFRTPALRRLALGLAATALTTQLPAWIKQEVSTAWADSARQPRELS